MFGNLIKEKKNKQTNLPNRNSVRYRPHTGQRFTKRSEKQLKKAINKPHIFQNYYHFNILNLPSLLLFFLGVKDIEFINVCTFAR